METVLALDKHFSSNFLVFSRGCETHGEFFGDNLCLLYFSKAQQTVHSKPFTSISGSSKHFRAVQCQIKVWSFLKPSGFWLVVLINVYIQKLIIISIAS